MTEVTLKPKVNRKHNWLLCALAGFSLLLIAGAFYVRSRPLVFNESFFSHAHCIPQASGAFLCYARDNSGRFPTHTNGYGDALLLLAPVYASWSLLTGPGGYDAEADKHWKQSGANVPESECGRVYVQGLTETNNAEIAILFDKVPTPGGDHCHGLKRLTAPLCRDVLLLDGSRQTTPESKWSEFAKNQIKLLVREGFDQATAEALYAEKGKTP
jgi:hypothetical protein